MADTQTSLNSRGFSWTDAKRAFLTLAILAVVAGCYWLLLPLMQSLIIPRDTGGTTGPWVLRPILAFRFGAMAVMAAVTISVILRPLQRRWQHEDAALGTRYNPLADRPVRRIVLYGKASLLLLVYGSGLVFYLFSWTIIGLDGIQDRLPWGTRHHSFQDIESLETIPEGERSESLRQDGPWYSIRLRSGRSITLSHDNEGSTPEELTAMAAFVAKHSGLVWKRRSDARASRAR